MDEQRVAEVVAPTAAWIVQLATVSGANVGHGPDSHEAVIVAVEEGRALRGSSITSTTRMASQAFWSR